jgi:hypothetical protein
MSEYLIISPKIAIDSMMYSGYKDTAHAVFELIDNSIQAGELLTTPVEIQVICVEKATFDNSRKGQNISHIAVYDNASGMTKDVLQKALQFGGTTRPNAKQGMGKFGMGLPNASISQCNRLEVYSWQNGTCYYTYLDVEEIKAGKYISVPTPKKQEVPKEWKIRIEYKNNVKIGTSGTLVIWSNLERLKWKRHTAFFKNTEFLIGRIYRHFLNEKKCSIRLAAYEDGNGKVSAELMVRVNDPLYLMSNTSAPGEFANEPAFQELLNRPVKIKDEFGKEWNVNIRASYAKQETRDIAHHSKHPLSMHCKRNTGISLVRASREIELNLSFVNQSDPTERWWGIEIKFPPALDKVFGITNNKQSATNFKCLPQDAVAEEEGVSVPEIMDLLEQENNPLKGVVDLTQELYVGSSSILSLLHQQIEKTAVSQKKERKNGVMLAEQAADNVVEQRCKEGTTGKSDEKARVQTDEEKKEEIKKEVDEKDLTPEEKQKTIIEWLKKDKFIFDYVEGLPYPWDILSFSTPAGKIKVSINTKHLAWLNIISSIGEVLGNETFEKVRDSITLLFAALARAEDEILSDEKKEIIQEHRSRWGRIARDMIKNYNDE